MSRVYALEQPMKTHVVVCDVCGNGSYKMSGKYAWTSPPLRKIATGVYRHDGCVKKGGS